MLFFLKIPLSVELLFISLMSGQYGPYQRDPLIPGRIKKKSFIPLFLNQVENT